MKADQLFIRKATKEDTEILVRLYHDAYAENVRIGFPASAAWVTAEEVLEWITQDTVLVAEYEGEIIGSVRLKVEAESEELYLCRLGVLSQWKGKGIATKLMNEAEKEAIHLGWHSIRLTTAIGHPYLPDMYLRRGYKQIGILELVDRPYDEYIMEKSLHE